MGSWRLPVQHWPSLFSKDFSAHWEFAISRTFFFFFFLKLFSFFLFLQHSRMRTMWEEKASFETCRGKPNKQTKNKTV